VNTLTIVYACQKSRQNGGSVEKRNSLPKKNIFKDGFKENIAVTMCNDFPLGTIFSLSSHSLNFQISLER